VLRSGRYSVVPPALFTRHAVIQQDANRFVQVGTVTNVPGFLTSFITSPPSDQTCVLYQYVQKRWRTAALYSASELPFRITATFWSAAVFCRFWIVESLLCELIPPIPKPN